MKKVTLAEYKKKSTTQNIEKANDYQQQRRKNNQRSVTIVGDSVVKHIKGYEMKEELPRNTRAFVRTHPGATTEDMVDYINPTRKFNSELYILHCGTNDLRTGKNPEIIADDIVQLALSLKKDDNEVALSSIIPRKDKFNDKGIKVNDCLRLRTQQFNLGFIEHTNIEKYHLNGSGLHLTEDGDTVLKNNFIEYINL